MNCIIASFPYDAGNRTRFAFSPMAKIKVRLGQALAGGAEARRIQMGSSPCRTKKERPEGLAFCVSTHLIIQG